MAEKYVNYVNLSDGTDLLDLRRDTVTEDTLKDGITAHDATGKPIVGRMKSGETSIIESGQCGDDVYWELYKNGLLVISGSGKIYDYGISLVESPFENRTDIKDIIIKEGITEITTELFKNCTNLESVIIQEGLKYIGGYAFGYCENLKTITLPNSLTNILFAAFSGCTNLTTVLYNGSKEDWDKIRISDGNIALNNATLYCEYDPNADTVGGWAVEVKESSSDVPTTTKPTLTFYYTTEG